MSTRSRIVLVCGLLAFAAGLAGFVAGVLGDRVWQGLPGLVTGVLAPCAFLVSRRQDRQDALRRRREE